MIERYYSKLEEIDPNCFYDAKYLSRRWGIHLVSVWRWVAKGVLPKPSRIGPNTSRWLGRVILEFERSRTANS